MWVNPNDENDLLGDMASMPTKKEWKGDFDELAKACNISVGANGRCQRDSIELTDQMYSCFQVA